MEQVFARVPREQVFDQTGIQFMQLNSLFQLYAMRLADAPALRVASTFLTMPDLFNFLADRAPGQRVLDRHHHPVLRPAQEDLGHRPPDPARPAHRAVWRDRVRPGTRLGRLRADVAAELGIAPDSP